MESETVNEELPPIGLQHLQVSLNFLSEILSKREENKKKLFSFLTESKNDTTKAKNRTMVLGKRKNTMTQNRANDEIDVSVLRRTSRRVGKMALLKNTMIISETPNRKLRRPTDFDKTTVVKKRVSEVTLSPLHASKYQRTQGTLHAGGTSKEKSVEDLESNDKESNGIEENVVGSDRTMKISKLTVSTTKHIEIDYLIPNSIDKDSKMYKQLTSDSAVIIAPSKVSSASADSGISEFGHGSSPERKKNNKESDSNTGKRTKIDTRTKVLKPKNKCEQENEEVRNNNLNEQLNDVIYSQVDESTNARPQRNVKKKNYTEQEEDKPQGTTKESKRTKASRKEKEQSDVEEVDIEILAPKSRTKVISKPIEEDLFADEKEIINNQEKTDNVKHVNEADNNNKNNNIQNMFASPKSGSVVKQRVEEFEKIQCILNTENGGRVTRTKTRAMAAIVATAPDVVEEEVVDNIQAKDFVEECGKENLVSNAGKKKDKVRGTPLANNNRLFSPLVESSSKPQTNKVSSANKLIVLAKSQSQDSITKLKEDEIEQKNKKREEASKKKEKTLRATADETRRKREEKLLKAAAAREAAEKEKAALALKHEKEKEEKNKLIMLEKEKLKEENERKKILHQQRLLEAEERRKLEEAARLAKLKEQEEEHKRLQALREREQETAERIKLEELKKKQAKKNHNSKLPKLNTATNAKLKSAAKAPTSSYDVTPHRSERPPLKPKTENDYGIDDAHTDDSSDDESQPKKVVPDWAQGKNRLKSLEKQKYLVLDTFMENDSYPDIKTLFSKSQLPSRMRERTSSAVWLIPPVIVSD